MWAHVRRHWSPGTNLGYLDILDFDYNWVNDFLDSSPFPNQMLAMGGTGIQAKCGVINTIASGNNVITGVGFRPDALIFCSANIYGTATHFTAGTRNWWGCCDENLNQWAMQNYRAYYYGSGLVSHFEGGVINSTDFGKTDGDYVEVTSLDTDGFTLNWTPRGQAGIPNYVCWMAIQCQDTGIRVGSVVQPAVGIQSHSGFGFAPKAIWFSGVGSTASGTYRGPKTAPEVMHGYAGVDAADTRGYDPTPVVVPMPNWEMCQMAGHNPGSRNPCWAANSPGQYGFTPSRCINWYGEVAPWTGGYKAQANINAWNADGFDLNWTLSDGNARRFGYMAFGADETWANVPGVDGAPLASLCCNATYDHYVTDRFGYYYAASASSTVGIASGAGGSAATAHVVGSYWGADSTVGCNHGNDAGCKPSGTFPVQNWRLKQSGVPVLSQFLPQIYRRQ